MNIKTAALLSVAGLWVLTIMLGGIAVATELFGPEPDGFEILFVVPIVALVWLPILFGVVLMSRS